jgi:hypothetical protein
VNRVKKVNLVVIFVLAMALSMLLAKGGVHQGFGMASGF